MALTSCEVCDGDLPAAAVSCPTCRSPVVRAVRRALQTAPSSVAPSAPDGAVVTEPIGAVCPAEGCGHVNVPGDARCFYCSTPLATTSASPAGVRLVLPWGEEAALPAGTRLVIGRDAPPLAGRLARYENVSRRHAEIAHDGTVTVEDLASTNGTTVNGRPVSVGQPVRLADGDVLGFGADLRVRVRLS